MKRPRHRVFDYTPRFYSPETDVQEKRKRKLGFTRQRKHKIRKRSPILWFLLILLGIYIYLKLKGLV